MPFTDQVLPELKNTYSLKRGLYCEQKVSHYFRKKGYILKNHRLKSKIAEVDLVLKHPQHGWLLVEVKSITRGGDFTLYRVGRRQKQRLLSFFEAFSCSTNEIVRLHLATVDDKGRVQIYEDFLCDLL